MDPPRFHPDTQAHAEQYVERVVVAARGITIKLAEAMQDASDLNEILSVICANAVPQPDANMGGLTDIYAVPLDDIAKAREILRKISQSNPRKAQ